MHSTACTAAELARNHDTATPEDHADVMSPGSRRGRSGRRCTPGRRTGGLLTHGERSMLPSDRSIRPNDDYERLEIGWPCGWPGADQPVLATTPTGWVVAFRPGPQSA